MNVIRKTVVALAGLAFVCMISTSARAAALPVSAAGNLALWLDATNINGNGDNNTGIANGQAIGTWVNAANNANAAVGVGGQRPTYVASGFGNGLPALRFTSLNELGDAASSMNVTGNAMTVFV